MPGRFASVQEDSLGIHLSGAMTTLVLKDLVEPMLTVRTEMVELSANAGLKPQ